MRPCRQAWLRIQVGKKLALGSLNVIRVHRPVESCHLALAQILVAMPVRLVVAEHGPHVPHRLVGSSLRCLYGSSLRSMAHTCRTARRAIARLPPCLFLTCSQYAFRWPSCRAATPAAWIIIQSSLRLASNFSSRRAAASRPTGRRLGACPSWRRASAALKTALCRPSLQRAASRRRRRSRSCRPAAAPAGRALSWPPRGEPPFRPGRSLGCRTLSLDEAVDVRAAGMVAERRAANLGRGLVRADLGRPQAQAVPCERRAKPVAGTRPVAHERNGGAREIPQLDGLLAARAARRKGAAPEQVRDLFGAALVVLLAVVRTILVLYGPPSLDSIPSLARASRSLATCAPRPRSRRQACRAACALPWGTRPRPRPCCRTRSGQEPCSCIHDACMVDLWRCPFL